MITDYNLVVSNIGHVHNGDKEDEAIAAYNEYVKLSRDNVGRAGGEDVTLFLNGEPIKEYQGTISVASSLV